MNNPFKTLLLGLLSVSSALMAQGCGRVLTCTVSGGSYCVDYTGSGYTAATIQALCASPNTYATSSCATANRVARCTTSAGTAAEYVTHYYSPGYSATTVQSACTAASGTYTAN